MRVPPSDNGKRHPASFMTTPSLPAAGGLSAALSALSSPNTLPRWPTGWQRRCCHAASEPRPPTPDATRAQVHSAGRIQLNLCSVSPIAATAYPGSRVARICSRCLFLLPDYAGSFRKLQYWNAWIAPVGVQRSSGGAYCVQSGKSNRYLCSFSQCLTVFRLRRETIC